MARAKPICVSIFSGVAIGSVKVKFSVIVGTVFVVVFGTFRFSFKDGR